MTNDNQDALRVAESHQKIARMNGGIRSVFISQKSLMESSAHLRRLVAENEAKDALLRQAVEALECSAEGGPTKIRMDAAITAAREWLEGRA